MYYHMFVKNRCSFCKEAKDILKKENKLKKVRGAGVYKSIWNPYISSIKGDIL